MLFHVALEALGWSYVNWGWGVGGRLQISGFFTTIEPRGPLSTDR